eukprot:1073508-Prymnesium_polylepis.1
MALVTRQLCASPAITIEAVVPGSVVLSANTHLTNSLAGDYAAPDLPVPSTFDRRSFCALQYVCTPGYLHLRDQRQLN